MPSNSSTVGDIVCSTETARKLVGGGNPTTRRRGDQENFQSSPAREWSNFGGALSLVYLKLGLCQSGCCGFMERGLGSTGSSRGSFAGTSCQLPCPHSCPVLGPGLLRLHGCDTSPAPRGLRGILETFIFSVSFCLLNFICVFILALLIFVAAQVCLTWQRMEATFWSGRPGFSLQWLLLITGFRAQVLRWLEPCTK